MIMNLSIVWLERIFEANYPIIIQRWVFPLVTAMLSLGLPLLINTIQRIEANYKTHGISSLLMGTCWAKAYIISIIAVVVSVIIYLLQIPRIVDVGEWCNALIDDSAAILLCLCSTSLLITMLGLVYNIRKYTTNPSGMYQLAKNKMETYFKNCAIQGKDEGLTYFLAIVEVAIKDDSSNLFDTILDDYKACIKTYRNSVIEEHSNEEDHLLVEYPESLLKGLFQLSERCMTEKCSVIVQERLYCLIRETFFEFPFSMEYRPKVGLSEMSIIALWDILVLATKNKCIEYAKLYWATIYEYVTMLYHAPYPPNVVLAANKYDRDKLKLERDLITFSHFIWQAYLYERKEYEMLKFALEYYNLGADVVELDYRFSGNAVGIYLSIEEYMSNINAGSKISGPDSIVQAFPCYEIRSNSEINKQYMMLANYTSFIIHKDYNLYDGVPYYDVKAVSTNRLKTMRSLRWALQNQKKGEPISISGTSIEKVMNESEIESYMWSIAKKDETGEKEFVAATSIRTDIVAHVWTQVYHDLEFEMLKHNHLWLLNMDASAAMSEEHNVQTVVAFIQRPKRYFIYTQNQYVYYTYGADLCGEFMRLVDEVVEVALSGKKGGSSVQKVHEDELPKYLIKQDKNERCVWFYSCEDLRCVEKLAAKWGWVYESQRGFISPEDADSKFVIKCIPIDPNDERVKSLIGQFWIMSTEEMPKIAFVEQEIRGDRKRLGEYFTLPTVTSKQKHAFNGLPILYENEIIEAEDGSNDVKLQLNAVIKVDVPAEIHARILQLDSGKEDELTDEENAKCKNEVANKKCICAIWTIIEMLVRGIFKSNS